MWRSNTDENKFTACYVGEQRNLRSQSGSYGRSLTITLRTSGVANEPKDVILSFAVPNRDANINLDFLLNFKASIFNAKCESFAVRLLLFQKDIRYLLSEYNLGAGLDSKYH